MKKSITLISCLFVLIGCKGPAGPQGSQGPTGLSGTGTLINVNGAVSSNDFNVVVPGLNIERGDVLNVYVCNNNSSTKQCTPVPAYSGGAFYRINETPSSVSLELVGFANVGTFYYIDALEK